MTKTMTTTTVPTTVTYLEMTNAPARLPPQPIGNALALMRVDPMPVHFYRYLYATVGRDYLWVERLVLSDEELQSRICAPGIEISVVYGNGAPAGYFELDFTEESDVYLAYFGLLPEWVGRRIGPWLLGCAVSEAFARGAKRIRLNTCTLDHPSALPFYQKMGFEPVGQEERVLQVPADMLPAD
jgi:GNAT superfamily N-acetyltransferase